MLYQAAKSQSPKANRQSPIANRQSPIANILFPLSKFSKQVQRIFKSLIDKPLMLENI
jgi:hypothetical protein